MTMNTEDVFLHDMNGILDAFPDMRAMGDCPQDPIFHSEGDVLSHTKMVLEALRSMEVYATMKDNDKAILSAAAVLHDFGKPLVTIEEDGRISSRNHASKGARAARTLLVKAGLPLFEREEIVSMILLHGLPPMLLKSEDPRRSVIRSSMHVRNDMLAILAAADTLGRDCLTDGGDHKARMDAIELFKEYCEEQRCLFGPFRFPSPATRFAYLAGNWKQPDLKKFHETEFTVVLLSGLPAAGKDTAARDMYADTPMISLDDIREEIGVKATEDQGRVIECAKDMAKNFLRRKRPFIWNATNITKHIRTALIGMFTNYGADVSVLYVEGHWEEMLRRNAARKHPVPANVMEHLLSKLEPPAPYEAHDVKYMPSLPAL
jgi:putative nucleotidyltransferase with HDIG domain